MKRLLLDQLRRAPGLYVGCTLFMAFIWAFPPQAFSAPWVVAWSLVVTYLAGPMRSFTVVSSREMLLLPISWQTRWRTQWTLAVMVPLVVTVAGQTIGLAVAAALRLPQDHPDAIVLSTLCDAAYAGFASGVLTIGRRQGRATNRPVGRIGVRRVLFWLILLSAVGRFALLLLGGLSGFLLYRFLPADLTALRGPAGGLIAAGIGTGAWTWFSWSALGPRPSLIVRVPSAGWRESSGPLPRGSRGESGAIRLARFGLVKAATHALVCAAIVAPFLLLVDNRDMVKVFWATIVFILGGVDWQQRLRQLRQLPLSTLSLNVVMISTTVTVWVVTMPLMAAAAFIAPSRFDAIPLVPVACAIIAVNVLAQSLMLRNKRSDYLVFLAFFLASRVVPKALEDAIPSISARQVCWLSLAAVALAAVVNYRTLTRSSTAYKGRPASAFPFGVPQAR